MREKRVSYLQRAIGTASITKNTVSHPARSTLDFSPSTHTLPSPNAKLENRPRPVSATYPVRLAHLSLENTYECKDLTSSPFLHNWFVAITFLLSSHTSRVLNHERTNEKFSNLHLASCELVSRFLLPNGECEQTKRVGLQI